MQGGYEADHGDKMLHALAYVSFQELATRVSHRNTGRASGDPACERLLTRVAADENLHMLFYRNLLAAAFELAPDETMPPSPTSYGLPDARPHDRRLPAQAVAIANAGIYDLQVHQDDVVGPSCASGRSSRWTASAPTAKRRARSCHVPRRPRRRGEQVRRAPRRAAGPPGEEEITDRRYRVRITQGIPYTGEKADVVLGARNPVRSRTGRKRAGDMAPHVVIHTPDTAPETPEARLRMDPEFKRRGAVDGGWWPHSRDATASCRPPAGAELPRGAVVRLSVDPRDWENIPRRLVVDGRRVRIGHFASMNHKIIATRGNRTTSCCWWCRRVRPPPWRSPRCGWPPRARRPRARRDPRRGRSRGPRRDRRVGRRRRTVAGPPHSQPELTSAARGSPLMAPTECR